MPIDLIALAAALICSGWFVLASDAPRLARTVVIALCAGSVLIQFLVRDWWLASLLLQSLLVIGIAFYAKAHP